MYRQLTLWEACNVIFSPGLADGPTPLSSQDGQSAAKYGRDLVPANRSRQQASEKAKRTTGTSGPSSSGSSKRAARKSFSASKSHPQKLSARSLRLLSLPRFAGVITQPPIEQQTDLLSQAHLEATLGGSMEYRQRWVQSATPFGFAYWEHTASGRRTSDSDCSGWPTPQAADEGTARPPRLKSEKRDAESSGARDPNCIGNYRMDLKDTPFVLTGWPTPAANEFEPRDLEQMERRRQECKERTGNGNGFGLTLGMMAQMAGWATPQRHDAQGGKTPEQVAAMRARGFGVANLNEQCQMADWNTPRATMALGTTPSSSPAETGKPAAFQLNASFSRWLMGYPATWDEVSPNYEAWRSVQDRIVSGV